MAPIVLVRRAVFVAINTSLILHTEARMMSFVLLNLGFLLLHIWMQPYKLAVINKMVSLEKRTL